MSGVGAVGRLVKLDVTIGIRGEEVAEPALSDSAVGKAASCEAGEMTDVMPAVGTSLKDTVELKSGAPSLRQKLSDSSE
jgi:hypothetical protein